MRLNPIKIFKKTFLKHSDFFRKHSKKCHDLFNFSFLTITIRIRDATWRQDSKQAMAYSDDMDDSLAMVLNLIYKLPLHLVLILHIEPSD